MVQDPESWIRKNNTDMDLQPDFELWLWNKFNFKMLLLFSSWEWTTAGLGGG